MKKEQEIREEMSEAKDELIKAIAEQNWATAMSRESYIHGLKYTLDESF